MGRFKKMSSAQASDKPEISVTFVSPDAAPTRIRHLTIRTLPDRERYERLKSLSINKSAGPLRSQAIERAALVQAHTACNSKESNGKICRIVARFLYDEALVYGRVDEERALTRENIDHWFFKAMIFH